MTLQDKIKNAWQTGVLGPLYWLQAPPNTTVPYTIAYKVGSQDKTTKDDVGRENAISRVQFDSYQASYNIENVENAMDAFVNTHYTGNATILSSDEEYIHDKKQFRFITDVRFY